MDTIKKYEALILMILEQEVVSRSLDDVQDVVIADKEKRHYQLLRMGWDEEGHYHHKIIFHFHIHEDGKIWLLYNQTDIPITDELLKRDVPASDIVLGLHPAKYRPYTGFAAA